MPNGSGNSSFVGFVTCGLNKTNGVGTLNVTVHFLREDGTETSSYNFYRTTYSGHQTNMCFIPGWATSVGIG
jgi:hypothetical protein